MAMPESVIHGLPVIFVTVTDSNVQGNVGYNPALSPGVPSLQAEMWKERKGERNIW